MNKILLTNEVAKVLDISIGTVRNYAKSLERAGHEFDKRQQARLWTDEEIELIQQVQQLYNNNDYPLELCFEYVVKRKNEGESAASDILEQSHYISKSDPTSPQLDDLRGDIRALINRFDSFEDTLQPHKQIEHADQVKDLQEQLQAANDEIALLQKENDRLETKSLTLSSEITVIKQMSMWEFRKYKKNYPAQPRESHNYSKNDDNLDFIP